MQRWLLLLPLSLAVAASLSAQSPATIDNDQAHVIYAKDKPHSKSTLHEHKLIA